MAACQAALDTYELLENIVSLLSPATIWKVRKVSKAWYQIIHDSKKIRTARCLAPLAWEEVSFNDCYSTNVGMPVYGKGTNIHLHPLLLTTYSIDTCNGRNTNRFKLLEHRPRTYEKKAAQFATKPRCQAIGIDLRGEFSSSGNCESVLYVKNGVGIQDVLDVARKMIQQASVLSGRGSSPVFAYGKIAEVVDEESRRSKWE